MPTVFHAESSKECCSDFICSFGIPPMEKAGERVIIFQGTGKNYQLGSKGDQKNSFVCSTRY